MLMYIILHSDFDIKVFLLDILMRDWPFFVVLVDDVNL